MKLQRSQLHWILSQVSRATKGARKAAARIGPQGTVANNGVVNVIWCHESGGHFPPVVSCTQLTRILKLHWFIWINNDGFVALSGKYDLPPSIYRCFVQVTPTL